MQSDLDTCPIKAELGECISTADLATFFEKHSHVFAKVQIDYDLRSVVVEPTLNLNSNHCAFKVTFECMGYDNFGIEFMEKNFLYYRARYGFSAVVTGLSPKITGAYSDFFVTAFVKVFASTAHPLLKAMARLES